MYNNHNIFFAQQRLSGGPEIFDESISITTAQYHSDPLPPAKTPNYLFTCKHVRPADSFNTFQGTRLQFLFILINVFRYLHSFARETGLLQLLAVPQVKAALKYTIGMLGGQRGDLTDFWLKFIFRESEGGKVN